MKTEFATNVSRSEALRRYVIGALLIGAVLLVPTVPSWIALFACYPIFTAMLQWDPANALLQKAVEKFGNNVGDIMFPTSTAN